MVYSGQGDQVEGLSICEFCIVPIYFVLRGDQTSYLPDSITDVAFVNALQVDSSMSGLSRGSQGKPVKFNDGQVLDVKNDYKLAVKWLEYFQKKP
jgi:hypothetical protein